MPRVAVLEDDADLRDDILVPGLRDYGFDITGAGTAAELYRHMLRQPFDMVVLDIGLPDEDGLSVVRHLRELSDLGIVMLTGQRTREDRIKALGDGADAFLAKPADVEVLAATLHSLSRRLQGRNTSAPTASSSPAPKPQGSWRLDTDGWCLVSPSGVVVALTVPERSVLHILVSRAGTPVGREALIAGLTEDVYDFDPHRLDMVIHRLRRKISEQTGESVPLVTARGAGYLFVTDSPH
ncbi:response regulator transcription factor [Dyella sp. C11]|uniref:response regulator transcription factor n=1 Tax=Dyella sp. C11 TaxID=2126991 RepID=UPI000D647BA9|nr:response regulator transcription factor [Dyella sp. C11]